MPATRDQLLTRWETTDGQQLAELTFRMLAANWSETNPASVRTLDPALVSRLSTLPFADEVAPRVDLRGLHFQENALPIGNIDLTNVSLDYAFPITMLSNCRTAGAILDQAFSVYGTFTRQQLAAISLAGASFQGGGFQNANLSEANLQGARLALTNFSLVDCTKAILIGADLRFANVHHTNFSGADLREVDFTEANLGDVIFDAQTRLQGANLQGAYLSDDLRAFAQQSGARLSAEQTNSARELAQLEATLTALQNQNADAQLLALVRAERDQFALDPDYDYYQGLEDAFTSAGSPQWLDEVMETWSDVSSALARYL